jgi:hypothetical protein
MEDQINQQSLDLIKIYIAQTQSALKISQTICEHSERKELSGDDIICGLIYRLMNPMSQQEINDSLNKADEILNDDYSSDEEDEDINFDNEKNILENNQWRKLKSNNCNCDICIKIRTNLLNYNNFQCNDNLSQLFQNSINETCNKYKINI